MVTAFTNIPHHKSMLMGNLEQLSAVFNADKAHPIEFKDTDAVDYAAALRGVNSGLTKDAFITLNPNTTINLTSIRRGGDMLNRIVHSHTIAKMLGIKIENNVAIISFEELEGETRPKEGAYEHMSITIDNFWAWMSIVASSVALVSAAVVATVATGGLAAGVLLATGTVLSVGTTTTVTATAVSVGMAAGVMSQIATIGDNSSRT